MIFLNGIREDNETEEPEGHNCPKENASGFDQQAIKSLMPSPSDLPGIGSTLHAYNGHCPSGDV